MECPQVQPAWVHVVTDHCAVVVSIHLIQLDARDLQGMMYVMHAWDLQVVYVKMVAVWDNKVSIFKRLLLLHMRVLSSNTCSSNILLYP